MSSKEVQRKRLALTITTNNLNLLMNDSSMQQSLAQLKTSSSTGGGVGSGSHARNPSLASLTQSSISPSVSSSSIYINSLLSSVSMAFTGGSNNFPTTQSTAAVSSTLTAQNNSPANSLLMQTQMKTAQVNELNSIMACVAMFASSMVNRPPFTVHLLLINTKKTNKIF